MDQAEYHGSQVAPGPAPSATGKVVEIQQVQEVSEASQKSQVVEAFIGLGLVVEVPVPDRTPEIKDTVGRRSLAHCR